MAAASVEWLKGADDYVYDDAAGQEAHQFIAPWTEEGAAWATHRTQEIRRWIRRRWVTFSPLPPRFSAISRRRDPSYGQVVDAQ
eukprot:9485444-Pyramimonas_sp.AAC.1